ncbi:MULTISPECIES: hypothetical protein [unclassified Acinetobacter]|nr:MULTISPECIES: hypothetical protein [unclassified Acinetobacter]
MKITQQQTSNMLQQHSQARLKIDFGAMCFFVLGMFLLGFFLHQIT